MFRKNQPPIEMSHAMPAAARMIALGMMMNFFITAEAEQSGWRPVSA